MLRTTVRAPRIVDVMDYIFGEKFHPTATSVSRDDSISREIESNESSSTLNENLMDAPPLRFQALCSSVDPAFWHALGARKIDEFRLSDEPRTIHASYAASVMRAAGSTGAPAVRLDGNAFEEDFQPPRHHFLSIGTLFNTNTVEQFKRLDKSRLIKEAGQQIWNGIISGKAVNNPHLLSPFILLTFADLKQHRYYYWFAFPAIAPQSARVCACAPSLISGVFDEATVNSLNESVGSFSDIHRSEKSHCPGYFLIARIQHDDSERLVVHELSEWDEISKRKNVLEVLLGFADPCGIPEYPGWQLRSFLILAAVQWNVSRIRVICIRDLAKRLQSSIVLRVEISGFPGSEDIQSLPCPRILGWELNKRGKPGARMVDLKAQMDPEILASSSVDLNLKLMKWNVMPDLQLDRISGLKCLLLGAGTLGCAVARNLMAWGVRHITFVDSGRVSYSNPVRQSLFTFDDSAKGRPKAECATVALRRIFPKVESSGHMLSIPMPGHPPAKSEVAQVESDTAKLHDLIRTHDCVFLLTDSRESRWLPTLLGAVEDKITINCALGFDSYMVMRHGVTPKDGDDSACRLGCYFCSDVVAPRDSLTDRTLDQQCTVTRPGLAHIAGALASEMLIEIVSHPDGPNASPPPPNKSGQIPALPSSRFGVLPHQLRGSLRDFQNILVSAEAFPMCTACSPKVQEEFQKRGWNFILDVLKSDTFLEELTGLAQLQKDMENLSVDWDDDCEMSSDSGDSKSS
eukprot:221426_1